MSEKIEILAATAIPVRLVQAVHRHFEVHDRRSHGDDPSGIEDAVLASVRGIIASGRVKVGAAMLKRMPKLEIISSYSAGVEGIDLAAAAACGVKVTATSDALAAEVADTAMFLAMDAARRFTAAERYTRAGKWPGGPFPLTATLAGKKMGIVGFGRIGKALARRAAAFEMEIRYNGRNRQPDAACPYEPSVKALAAWSDILVLALPGGPETLKLIDADILKALGPEGYLVNVARGSVVDEAALVAALQKGEIAGAALDVFEKEPHVPPAFFDLPNATLLPHMASGTHETRAAMARMAYENLTRHFGIEPTQLSDQELDTTAKA